jgi:hypothetical protein
MYLYGIEKEGNMIFVLKVARYSIICLCVSGCFLVSGIAEASNIKLGGEISTEYERYDYGGALPSLDSRHNIYAIDGVWKPEKNIEAYVRYSWQEFKGDNASPSESALDKYGIRIKRNNIQWTLGTQALYLGAFGGLMDLEDKAGDRLFNGVELLKQGKTGQIRLLSGHLGGSLFADGHSREMSSVQFGSKIRKTGWTVTALSIPDLDGADRFVDLSFEHPVGKITYLAEFIRSNGESGTGAKAVGFYYCFDDKNAFGLMCGEAGKSSLPQGQEILGASENGIQGIRLRSYHLTKAGMIIFEYVKAHSTIYDMNINTATLSYTIRF